MEGLDRLLSLKEIYANECLGCPTQPENCPEIQLIKATFGEVWEVPHIRESKVAAVKANMAKATDGALKMAEVMNISWQEFLGKIEKAREEFRSQGRMYAPFGRMGPDGYPVSGPEAN